MADRLGPTAKPRCTDAEAALHRRRSRLAPTAKPPWTDGEAALHRLRQRD